MIVVTIYLLMKLSFLLFTERQRRTSSTYRSTRRVCTFLWIEWQLVFLVSKRPRSCRCNSLCRACEIQQVSALETCSWNCAGCVTHGSEDGSLSTWEVGDGTTQDAHGKEYKLAKNSTKQNWCIDESPLHSITYSCTDLSTYKRLSRFQHAEWVVGRFGNVQEKVQMLARNKTKHSWSKLNHFSINQVHLVKF